MLVFFFPSFEISAVSIRQHARARTVLFLKGISAAIFFVEKLYGMRACALGASALCMRLPVRAGPPATAPCSPALGGSAAKWTNVVWPIKSRQTNKPTNKQTNTHYSFIGIDIYHSEFHHHATSMPGIPIQYLQESLDKMIIK